MTEQQKQQQQQQPKTWKKDFLQEIAIEIQQEWETVNVFESKVPDTDEQVEATRDNTYFVTFTYPYQNGAPHLGHTFTVTKSEFATAYHMLCGKACLFPFAYHCSGMPIRAAADKLKREMDEYGVPPKFPEDQEGFVASEEHDGPGVQLKKKQLLKQGTAKRQWNIMKSLGVPEDLIHKFADPYYWCDYFPPQWESSLKKLGCHIDWTKGFVTTDLNPFYDSFIRWQFRHLKKQDKVKFGKRYCVWSPKDGQPCMDHDRATGEGVAPEEFTIIKLELLRPYPSSLASLEADASLKIFLAPATLRPETMYGQTNCWVLPTGRYGCYRISDTEALVLTEKAARNLSFQGFSRTFGQVECLQDNVPGTDLIGCAVNAPLTSYDKVYVLPMMTISMKIGTGVVTSVPSDAPDDFASLRDLQKKEKMREKFGIQDDWVLPFKPIPIIDIPGIGQCSAEFACEKFKVNSQNDRDQLAAAKELTYKKGFYEGVMLVGDFKGKPVQEAKDLVTQQLLDRGEALAYAEPKSTVMSRSGDECVVCLADQWFLDYGEDNWKAQTKKALDRLDAYVDEAHLRLEEALDWLHQWACCRTYGLGTKLPWDEKYLVESLSDSTIYMAFYTVVDILQQAGSLKGEILGPYGIKPEQLTDDVWDYIFLQGDLPSGSEIPVEALEKCRRSFRYWYPLNVRGSGKDLIRNHLTFMLYNHTAIFPEEYWPKSIKTNGLLMLDGEKMSKSTGNFMTLEDALETFGSDATRLALAEAGDTLEDANFSRSNANAIILKLYDFFESAMEIIGRVELVRDTKVTNEFLDQQYRPADSPLDQFPDILFREQMYAAVHATKADLDALNFRDATIHGFHEMIALKNGYVAFLGDDVKPHRGILREYVELQVLLLATFSPHLCEYIWEKMGKRTETGTYVVKAGWPDVREPNQDILAKFQYVQSLKSNISAMFNNKQKRNASYVPEDVSIFVSKTFNEVDTTIAKVVKADFEKKKAEADNAASFRYQANMKALIPVLMKEPVIRSLPKNRKNQTMGKVRNFLKLVEKSPEEAFAEKVIAFDELAYLQSNLGWLKKQLFCYAENVKNVQEVSLRFVDADAPDAKVPGNKEPSPGEPVLWISP